jgi:hypothetical protein
MDDRNERYHSLENRMHPLVRGEYAIFTPPMLEAINWIIEWIDSKASGGYVVGFSRFGKSRFARFCVSNLIAEHYRGAIPVFVHIFQGHKLFSEPTFLLELLKSSNHIYTQRNRANVLFDRLSRHYATMAGNAGGNQIVLIIDEAQGMSPQDYRLICNLENELDRLGFRLTVISVASHEMNYNHETMVNSGHIHLNGRYFVRHCRFRGITNINELATVLRAFDSQLIWPEDSKTSYTRFFFPYSFEENFRFENCAKTMWKCYERWGYKHAKFALEVPMEHIAKAIEFLCRNVSDSTVLSEGMIDKKIEEAIESTEYEAHMAAISVALGGKRRGLG